MRKASPGTAPFSQEEYAKRYDGLVERYKNRNASWKAYRLKAEREFKEEVYSGFLFEIIELEDMDTAFQPVCYNKTVDHISVHNDGRLVFTFFVGKEIAVEL